MTTRVPIVEKILSANDRLASENRAKFDAAGVFAIKRIFNFLVSVGRISFKVLYFLPFTVIDVL